MNLIMYGSFCEFFSSYICNLPVRNMNETWRALGPGKQRAWCPTDGATHSTYIKTLGECVDTSETIDTQHSDLTSAEGFMLHFCFCVLIASIHDKVHHTSIVCSFYSSSGNIL